MLADETVFLDGLQFYVYHGVNPEEQSLSRGGSR